MTSVIKIDKLSKLDHIGRASKIPQLPRGGDGRGLAPWRRFRTAVSRWTDGAVSTGGEAPKDTIWALKDVSLEVAAGDVVGIVGHNGSGKSTLLKILSRVTRPTSGRAELRGRVGSLLEVGTGFHPELTGRENIYLNGAILGMKLEVRLHGSLTRSVSAFSGIENFLDTPSKYYSSGMYVRLAFAVAAHLETEILIVDEVIAVGDVEFQRKCLGKLSDLNRSGRTVLFVSHNMAVVQNLCTHAVFLANGRVMAQGECANVLTSYLETTRPGEDGRLDLTIYREPGKREVIRHITTRNDEGLATEHFLSGSGLTVEIGIRLANPARQSLRHHDHRDGNRRKRYSFSIFKPGLTTGPLLHSHSAERSPATCRSYRLPTEPTTLRSCSIRITRRLISWAVRSLSG